MVAASARAAALVALALLATWWHLFRSVQSPLPTLSAPATSGSIRTPVGERTYTAFIPARLAPDPALLIVLHGSRGSADQMRRYTGQEFERLADEHGFIVVHPDGYRGYWNDARRMGGFAAKTMHIDDVAFLRALVGRFKAEHHTGRTFMVGYSNGGYMAMRMALDAPDLVDGLAVLAANMPTDDNSVAAPPSRALPVMFVNGTRDPITPYEGGRVTIFGFGDRGTVRSSVASAEYFAAQLGAGVRHEGPDVIQPAVANTPTSVDRQSWGDKVLLYTIHGGGHSIPQPNYRFARFVGPTEMRFNAPAASWDFFVRTAGASDLRRPSLP